MWYLVQALVVWSFIINPMENHVLEGVGEGCTYHQGLQTTNHVILTAQDPKHDFRARGVLMACVQWVTLREEMVLQCGGVSWARTSGGEG
jgi:hypothetical protein